MATLSSTLATARLGMAQIMGEVVTGTTTNAGDTTSLIDATNLVHYGNDKFNTWWILLTSGTYSGSIVRVTDFAQATGDCTFTPALAGNVGNTVTYELHKYHPTNQLRWALNKALQMSHPELRKEVTCDDLVSGNWLMTGAMEDWTNGVSAAPDGWGLNGAGAIVARESRGATNAAWYWGSYGVGLTRVGTDCYLAAHQGIWPQMMDLFGKSVRLETWARCATADRARVSLYADVAGTLTSQGASSYATASLTQLLRTDELTMPALSQGDAIEARLEINTGNVTGYFDNVRLIGPSCYVYAMPLAFQHKDPEEVLIQTGSWAEGNERPCDDRGDTYPYRQLDPSTYSLEYDNVLGIRLIRFKTTLPVGYRIRLHGSEYMATVSADTDTMLLNPPQLNVLYPLAARELFESLAMNVGVTSGAGKEYLDQAAFMNSKWLREKARAGQKTFSMGIKYGNWRY